jgi:hypothetical protein
MMLPGTIAIVAALLLTGCLEKSDESGFTGLAPGSSGGANSPPSISGNPPAGVKVGEAYSFTPTASDPDGDSLTFSIENAPNWATFDSGTGSLAGTPTLANVGDFSNIRITVSDGSATSSMSGFTIAVTQVALGSTTLSWSAPTQNEDGSTLTDLAGYKIYYGRASGDYSNEIRIDNPSVTTYLVDNLSPDTYFFAATALNSAGIESRFSGEAVKTID